MLLQPAEIELKRGKELRIRWKSGESTTIPLADLRRACPCALCRDERERGAVSGTMLPTVRSPAEQQRQADVERAELVGQYALRIIWQDGHDTGMYDYDLLYTLGCRHEKAQRRGHPPGS